jgi:hypothetical protein
MATTLTVKIDLDNELDEERITADDLVDLLCSDSIWAAQSLSNDRKKQLRKLVDMFEQH